MTHSVGPCPLSNLSSAYYETPRINPVGRLPPAHTVTRSTHPHARVKLRLAKHQASIAMTDGSPHVPERKPTVDPYTDPYAPLPADGPDLGGSAHDNAAAATDTRSQGSSSARHSHGSSSSPDSSSPGSSTSADRPANATHWSPSRQQRAAQSRGPPSPQRAGPDGPQSPRASMSHGHHSQHTGQRHSAQSAYYGRPSRQQRNPRASSSLADRDSRRQPLQSSPFSTAPVFGSARTDQWGTVQDVLPFPDPATYMGVARLPPVQGQCELVPMFRQLSVTQQHHVAYAPPPTFTGSAQDHFAAQPRDDIKFSIRFPGIAHPSNIRAEVPPKNELLSKGSTPKLLKINPATFSYERRRNSGYLPFGNCRAGSAYDITLPRVTEIRCPTLPDLREKLGDYLRRKWQEWEESEDSLDWTPSGMEQIAHILGSPEGRARTKWLRRYDPVFARLPANHDAVKAAVMSSAFSYSRRSPFTDMNVSQDHWGGPDPQDPAKRERGGLMITSISAGYTWGVAHGVLDTVASCLPIPPPFVLAYAWLRLSGRTQGSYATLRYRIMACDELHQLAQRVLPSRPPYTRNEYSWALRYSPAGSEHPDGVFFNGDRTWNISLGKLFHETRACKYVDGLKEIVQVPRPPAALSDHIPHPSPHQAGINCTCTRSW